MEASVAAGGTPFFVGATCGSTVLGTFDPLPELAQVRAFLARLPFAKSVAEGHCVGRTCACGSTIEPQHRVCTGALERPTTW